MQGLSDVSYFRESNGPNAHPQIYKPCMGSHDKRWRREVSERSEGIKSRFKRTKSSQGSGGHKRLHHECILANITKIITGKLVQMRPRARVGLKRIL